MAKRNYQSDGTAFLAGRPRAILGDEMGLGKSRQAINAADQVDAKSVTVVCPASVRPHWLREFRLWSRRDWPPQIVETTSEVIDPDADLVICSYATARAPAIHRQLRARQISALILDEVQGLRSATTQQTRAIYGRRCDGMGGLLEWAEYAWGLSGSICPNGWARELHTHLRAYNATTLTTAGFDRRFHVMKETKWGSVPYGHRNTAELKEILRPIYLRRTVAEVASDLPPLTVTTTPIEADTRALLEAEQVPALAELRAAIAAGDDASVLQLLEHASGETVARLRHGTAMLKVPGANALLGDELAADPAYKVAVFAMHRAVIDGLAEGLAEFGTVTLDGSTRSHERQQRIDRFANNPACRVFIAQITAGGLGISLVSAAHVVMVEASWTPADNAQAVARCRRIGQRRPVLARYLYVPGSLDEAIAAVLARKSQMASELEAA